MRSWIIVAVALLALTGTAHAGKGLEFEYALEQEREGQVQQTDFIKGFDVGGGLRLRVKLEQPSYCYLIADDGKGTHHLAFPGGGPLPEALAAGRARIPATTFVRFHDEDVARFFLVVASQRVPELEQALDAGGPLSATLVLEIRDRYQGHGAYKRDAKSNGIAVSWRADGEGPDVVVEGIALRRAGPARPTP